MNKRGSTLLTDSLPELILAVASVIILVLLMNALIGTYNKDDEGAKVLLEYLETSIETSNKLIMYSDTAPTRYFLVYFTQKEYVTGYSYDTYKFYSVLSNPANSLCICTVSSDDTNPIKCQSKYCIKGIELKNSKGEKASFAIPLDIGTTINFTCSSDSNCNYLYLNMGQSNSSAYSSTEIRKESCKDFPLDNEYDNYHYVNGDGFANCLKNGAGKSINKPDTEIKEIIRISLESNNISTTCYSIYSVCHLDNIISLTTDRSFYQGCGEKLTEEKLTEEKLTEIIKNYCLNYEQIANAMNWK